MKDITLSSNLKALQGIGPSKGLSSPGESKGTDGPSFADTLAQSLDKVNTLQKEADVAIQLDAPIIDFARWEQTVSDPLP